MTALLVRYEILIKTVFIIFIYHRLTVTSFDTFKRGIMIMYVFIFV